VNAEIKYDCRVKALFEPAGRPALATGFWRKNLPERQVRQLVFFGKAENGGRRKVSRKDK
jgi:hypothetical protein